MPASRLYTVGMSRQLTVRGVPEEVGSKLEAMSRNRGQSMNSTIVEILSSAVGFTERRKRLERFATWTQQDLEEFQQSLADQRRIDEDLWR